MRCFYHHEVEAVGVCKNCCKGICPDCLTDVGNGIACTNACAAVMMTKNKQVKMNVGVSLFSALSLVVVGLLLAYHGYGRHSMVSIVGGVWFAVMGIIVLIRSKIANANN